MKKRHSPEQIIAILREVETKGSVAEVCRAHAISDQTFYRWKRKFGGLQVSEAKRIRQLERENAKLKRLVAEQALCQQVMEEELGKRGWA